MAVRIGELLLKEKRITPEQLQNALNYQRQNGGKLAANLVKLGYVKDGEITALLSKQYGVPAIALEQFEIDPAVIKLVPAETARKYQIVPLSRAGATLTVAMTDPTNVFAMDDVKFMTGYNVEPVVASETAVLKVIGNYYGADSSRPPRGERVDPAPISATREEAEPEDPGHSPRKSSSKAEPDVFISYATEDAERAKTLAEAIETSGWQVWWDRTLVPGVNFRREIARQLDAARCVVVLWSKESIESDWVVDEATHAKERNVLVQVLIDGVAPPFGFRQQHFADLTRWNGDPEGAGFARLKKGISRLVPPE